MSREMTDILDFKTKTETNSEKTLNEYTIVSFYKFINLNNLISLQKELKAFCQAQAILGTILLGKEGINATLVGLETNLKAFISFLQNKPPFSDIDYKYSVSEFIPFQKMKVSIKKEIVTFKMPNINPAEKTGTEIEPKDWNDLMSDPEVLVIDTRNNYEVAMGTFKNAINPETDKFTEFPDFVRKNLDPERNKKIAMFCTGGIRCEKASSYLLEQGFQEVYQLKGGILKYLEQIPLKESLWQGDCFVFDDRILIDKQSIKKNN